MVDDDGWGWWRCWEQEEKTWSGFWFWLGRTAGRQTLEKNDSAWLHQADRSIIIIIISQLKSQRSAWPGAVRLIGSVREQKSSKLQDVQLVCRFWTRVSLSFHFLAPPTGSFFPALNHLTSFFQTLLKSFPAARPGCVPFSLPLSWKECSEICWR